MNCLPGAVASRVASVQQHNSMLNGNKQVLRRSLAHRVPFFYGWVIVAAALTINIASTPLNPVVFSFFLAPMSEDLSVSKGVLSLALTFRLVLAGVTAPAIGYVLDRFGPRWLGAMAGLAAGASLVGLYFVRDLWVLYLLFALAGGVGLAGGVNLITSVPVAKWFIIKRGRALAIATIGMAAGTAVAIPAVQGLIEAIGWRSTWVLLGITLAVVTCPTSLLLLRGSPADMGLSPDGAPASDRPGRSTRSRPVVATQSDWTLGQALRTPVLWQVLAATAIMSLVLTGVLVQRVAFWTEAGMSPALVAFGTAMDPLTFMISALIFGVVAERVPIRRLGFIGGMGLALSLVPMLFPGGGVYSILSHNIIWGSGAGAWVTLNNLVWANYFGRRFLGTISGVVIPVTIVASGAGPPLYGFLLDWGVAPTALWGVSSGVLVVAGTLLLLARPPVMTQRPGAEVLSNVP